MGDFRRAQDLFPCDVGISEGDVFVNGLRKQERVLRHDAQVPAVIVQPQVGEGNAVDENLAVRRPVKRGHERNERALA